MVKEITIPDIGENVKSGQVVGLLVSVGDMVEQDDGIIEYETEKAVVEIPSPHAGKITEILVKEGDEIDVGAAIAKIDTDASAEEEPEEEAPPESEVETAEETEEEPKEEQAEEEEEKEEAPKEEEGEKEAAGAESEEPPKKKAEPSSPGKSAPSPPKKKPRPVSKGEGGEGPLPASPSVRRLARELGVQLNEVAGSGPGGRISLDDVKTHVREVVSTKPTTPSEAARGATAQRKIKPLPDFAKWGDIETENLSRVRKAIADGTAYSWPTIPRVTQFDEADVTELEQFIKRHKGDASDKGGKLTITAVLLKACAAALKTFPRFNASIDTENNQIIYKKYYHLGVAAETDRGLLVPVVRDVDRKGLLQIASEMNEIVRKARDKKISPDEMEGSTFVISNQGSIGGTNFTPLVYWPQVAILGASRTATHPRWIDGEWRPRRILPLSLSYDHRIIDGADAARFLGWLVEALQQPMLMQLD